MHSSVADLFLEGRLLLVGKTRSAQLLETDLQSLFEILMHLLANYIYKVHGTLKEAVSS